MSATTALPSSNSCTIQQVLASMSEAERDIRRSLAQVAERPVSESDQACKEIGRRIAGIEASLAAVKPDEDTLESFHDLTADLRCLSTRISIVARKTEGPNALANNAGYDLTAALKERPVSIPSFEEPFSFFEEPQGASPALPTSGPSAQPIGNTGNPTACNFPRLIEKISKIPYTNLADPNAKCKPTTYGVFPTSNEYGQRIVNNTLRFEMKNKIPGGVHFGTSALYNLDHMAAMRSSFAILADFNPNVADFLRRMIGILSTAKSIEDFEEQASKEMEKDIERDPKFYNDNAMWGIKGNEAQFQLKKMVKYSERAFTPENFAYLQKMAQEGKIVALHLDLCDTNAIKTIADAVHAEGLVFSSIYLSNVYDYFVNSPELRKAFKQNIDALKQDRTCIIDTTMYTNRSLCVDGFAFYGKDPETGHAYDPDILRSWCASQVGMKWADMDNTVDGRAYYTTPSSLERFARYYNRHEDRGSVDAASLRW